MSQLYTEYKNITLPYSVTLVNGQSKKIITRTYKSICIITWPNGKPCLSVNAWLMSIASTTTGKDAVRTSAALISPLIRYCYRNKIEFHEISDAHFYSLKKYLLNEKKESGLSLDPVRLTNQAINIMQRAIVFLMWYQKNIKLHFLTDFAGTDREAQLKLTKKINVRTGAAYYTHELIPDRTAPANDKQPIDPAHISIIQDEIYRQRTISDRKIEKNSRSEAIIARQAKSEYIYNRRMFVIWLMEFCGLRPEEMEEMPLEENRHPLATKVIVLPTKKTRELPTPTRRIRLNTDDAAELIAYLEARDHYINHLIDRKIIRLDPKTFFITEHGNPIPKESIARDFKRISTLAGLTDTRICLSMFRHLFITRQMTYAIQSELNQSSKNLKKPQPLQNTFRGLAESEAFKLKVCREIIPLTGHRRASSVFHYFHDTLIIVGRFVAGKQEIQDINDTHSAMNSLTRIKHEAMRENNVALVSEINDIKRRWNALKATPPK